MHASDAQNERGIGPPTIVAASLPVMFIGATPPTPLYPRYRQRFDFSEVSLTLVHSVYVLGNLAALLYFARLSDQVGRRITAWPTIGIRLRPAPRMRTPHSPA